MPAQRQRRSLLAARDAREVERPSEPASAPLPPPEVPPADPSAAPARVEVTTTPTAETRTDSSSEEVPTNRPPPTMAAPMAMSAPPISHAVIPTIRPAPPRESQMQVRRAPPSPLRWVFPTFSVTVGLTLLCTMIPWFVLVSPRLHDVFARASAPVAAPVVTPPAQPVFTPPPAPIVVMVPEPAPVVDAVADPPEEPVEPAPVPDPRPTPVSRPPRPKVTPIAPVTPPDPVVVADPVEPKPVVVEPPPPPAPVTPAAAKALDGRYTGTMGGKLLVLDLAFKTDGVVRVSAQRGDGASVVTTGQYVMRGDRATVTFLEPGDGGASYTATVAAGEAQGRATFVDGKSQRFTVTP